MRFSPQVVAGGVVLDVACGNGRHTRWFLDRGHPVVAVDRDLRGIGDLMVPTRHPQLTAVEADLEEGVGTRGEEGLGTRGAGQSFPFVGQRFAAVVVTNYLYRPLLPEIVAAVDDGGWLLYETFARGNEQFGRPSNPDFLLRSGELLDSVRGQLRVVAYEDVVIETPRPAAVQRLAATRVERGTLSPRTTSRSTGDAQASRRGPGVNTIGK